MIKTNTVLACWADPSNALQRVGNGPDYNCQGAESGSFRLSFRATEIETPGRMAYSGLYEACPSDLSLYVYLGYRGDFNLGFEVYSLHSANERKLTAILALLKKWNKQADKLYMGGTESLDTALRRMIKATGARNGIDITSGSNTYNLRDIEEAIRMYVNPAVGYVRSRMKDKEMAA